MDKGKSFKNPLKVIALMLLKGYRYGISPILVSWFGPSCGCRHEPTCSVYAQQAIEKFGFFRGVYLSARRLFRCHPWGTSGYDPVPQSPINFMNHHG
jgi:hypothetical protein